MCVGDSGIFDPLYYIVLASIIIVAMLHVATTLPLLAGGEAGSTTVPITCTAVFAYSVNDQFVKKNLHQLA